MDHLEEITVEELQGVLERVEAKKPTQRLTAAIAYKRGITQTEIADWYDVERKTVYNWLMRLDAESIADAVCDGDRTGRDRKLSGEERASFERVVQDPPTAVGYDEPGWTPALVRRYVAERFDVDYSIPSCRRLLREAGLRYRPGPSTGSGSVASDSERGVCDPSGGFWVPVDG